MFHSFIPAGKPAALALAAALLAPGFSSFGQGPTPFRAQFQADSQNRYILTWPAQSYCQYQVERSTGLNTWETIATLYNFSGASVTQSFHALTVQPGEPPPASAEAPAKPLAFFTVRKLLGGPHIASWTGADGLPYAAVLPTAPPPNTPPVVQIQTSSYAISVLLIGDATAGTQPELSGVLPPEESLRWAAFTSVIPALADTPASTGVPAVAGSSHSWRVREIIDSDGDGLPDATEVNVWHTDPFLADSDGDGRSDLQETAEGSNPLDIGDGITASFRLNWDQLDTYTLRPYGYESGAANKPTLAKYRKRETSSTRTYLEPYTNTAGKSGRREDSVGKITEEILDGGVPQVAPNNTLLPKVRWTMDFTVGQPVPTSDSVLRDSGFAAGATGRYFTIKSRYVTPNLYSGSWIYGVPKNAVKNLGLDSVNLFLDVREWDNDSEFYQWTVKNWTWDSNSPGAFQSTNATEPGNISDFKPLLRPDFATQWSSLTSATGSKQLTYAGTNGPVVGGSESVTVTLSDPLTYPGQRSIALALPGGWAVGSTQVTDQTSELSTPGMSSLRQDEWGAVTVQRYRFKFRRPPGTVGTASTKIYWLEKFTPADLPETAANEALNPPPPARIYSWTSPAGATESPVIELDPTKGPFSGGVPGTGVPDRGTVALGQTKVCLLNVDFNVTSPGETITPKNGLCVVKNSEVMLDLNGDKPASAWPIDCAYLYWQWRYQKPDGSYSGWTVMSGAGVEVPFPTDTPGIYQVKAAIYTLAGEAAEIAYTRKTDSAYSEGENGIVQAIHKKGSLDSIGVVQFPWQKALRDTAMRQLGSTFYAYLGRTIVHDDVALLSGQSKAQVFVYHKANDNQLPVPLVHAGGGPEPIMPPLSVDWWNDNTGRVDNSGTVIVSKNIPNWSRTLPIENPQPGWVVSRIDPSTSGPYYLSNVGFLDYDGTWISAEGRRVSRYYHLASPNYQVQAFKKYTGGN